MTLNSDVSSALHLLENIQSAINQTDDVKLLSQTNADLNILISLLDNPIFRGIVAVQDSLGELNNEIQEHPSILPVDFDLTLCGQLVISAPQPSYQPDFINSPNIEVDDQRVPVAQLSHSSSGDPNSPQLTSPGPDDLSLTPITNAAYAREFQKAIDENSRGREVLVIQLFKPEGFSLGFSVVGLKSEEKGELGIFVQEIQGTGIAGRDGRLHEGDQILAIDGQPLDSNISHQQAISILQKARGPVELVVARTDDNPPSSPASSPTPSAVSETSKNGSDMVLNTEWAQVEVIDLINDGSGLGFGIIGGRSTGVVVKTILPGGVADRDGRLQSGDHILQIGDVNLRGMGSEQVAAVLRQSGSHVRLVVARPVEPTSPDYQALASHAPIVPTKILADPEELDRHLLQNGYPQVTYNSSSASSYDNPFIFQQDSEEISERDSRLEVISGLGAPLPLLTMDMIPLDAALPEMERFSVELKKDSQGLGITIAGYVCEKEELSGIFVKSISEGSAADMCKKIQVNDRIVEVDGQSLQGFTNHDAVEVLRSTGTTVMLTLERYLRGPKFEQLQQAIANSELKPSPSSPSAVSLPRFPISTDGESAEIEVEGESVTTIDSVVLNELAYSEIELSAVDNLIDDDYTGPLKPHVELSIKAKWSKILGPDVEIVVGQLCKFSEGGGLGISLEGTVDVEDGQEVRPHHYIRSILAEGPVGQNGRLKSGDELLEVNGHRLLGMNHIEVVTILKELPVAVRMVCARRKGGNAPLRLIDTSQDRAAFAARSILGGSLQNLIPSMDRLVKAKSDGSLASNTTIGTEPNLSKLRSRSLEPITGLAMWSSEPHIIELHKGDRGLGFSILDYQDPMNPSETVIVIRSLVPGGVAQLDGRLIPGDRLLSVNSASLDNASLDEAVQALKGAAKGLVRIAVAKPLPIPDSVSHSQDVEEPLSENTPTLDDHSMYSCSESIHTDDVDPLDAGSLPDFPPAERNYKESEVEDLPFPEAPPSEDLLLEESSGRLNVEEASCTKGGSELEDDSLVELPPSVSALPELIELDIVVNKKDEDLGVILEYMNDSFCGALVAGFSSSEVELSTHLNVGDVITWVNDDCLSQSTESEFHQIIDKLKSLKEDIRIKYITRQSLLDHISSPSSSDEKGKSKLCSTFTRLAVGGLDGKCGRDSASDRESEYADCLEDKTYSAGLSSAERASKLDSSSSTVHIPPHPNPTQQLDYLPIEESSESVPISNHPEPLSTTDISETSPTVPKNNNNHHRLRTNKQDSVDFDKVIKESSPKIIDSLITSSLESLSNFKVRKELVKGVSEPVLNKKNSVDISQVFNSFNRSLKGSEMTVREGASPAVLVAKNWGPERTVQVFREPDTSLGISIVGGKVDLYNTAQKSVSTVSGIFIKNVIQDSPAGRTGELKAGDRILQVDGIDLSNASHETAVYVIRSAGNPVNFLIQSLVHWDLPIKSVDKVDKLESKLDNAKEVTETPEKEVEEVKKVTVKQIESSEESSDEEEAIDYESKVRSSAGEEISRASAGNVKMTQAEKESDPEKEDQFGYTESKCTIKKQLDIQQQKLLDNQLYEKVLKKYGHLGEKVVLVTIEKKDHCGLGLALAGHKDRNTMAVFVCGVLANSSDVQSTLQVGDQLLEVNGIVVHNRSHLNASAIIKGLPGPVFKIIVLRKTTNMENLSVKPISHFPMHLQELTLEQRYGSFKGVKNITLKKTGHGLGIMIIEGKHAEVGQGIFISDIQDGSVAQQAGLKVGDMILAVNKDCLLRSNYDNAAELLKKTEGVVTLTVCSPRAKEDETKPNATSPAATPSKLTPTSPNVKQEAGSPHSGKLKSEADEAMAAATAQLTPGADTLIEINRDKLPLGVSVVGGSDTPFKGIFVQEILPESGAAKDSRLSPGDQILEFAGEDFRDICHEKAVNSLRLAQTKIKILVHRRDGSNQPNGIYNVVEVDLTKKAGKGMGLAFGCLKLISGVYVSDIVSGGAAAADGRVAVGDIVLSVNGQDVKGLNHLEVAALIKSSLGRVTLQLGRYKLRS